MKLFPRGGVVWLAAALGALPGMAADLTGRWVARFDGPVESRPKMVREIILDLKPEAGGRLSGTMAAGNWPGRAALMEGRIEGERCWFVAVGKVPWNRKSPAGAASGLPRLAFSGELRSKGVLRLRLVWDSAMLYGSADAPAEYELTAKRRTGREEDEEEAADPSPPDL